MTDDLKHVRLLSEGVKHRVIVDGVELTDSLSGAHLTLGALDVPHLVLEVAPTSTLSTEFDGLAKVAIGEPPDPGAAAAVFLDAIDPEELERAALNVAHEYPGEHGLTKALLATLSGWANGRP